MSPAADVARTAARGMGQLLVTAGAVILLFVAYELWWTNLYTNREQHHLRQVFQREIRASPAKPCHDPRPANGHALALLRIPRLGVHYEKVVVEGVSVSDLHKGPGHYPKTALPGGRGNFVVSGHRTTYGSPFYNLDRVHVGDRIIVQTCSTYTYRVTGKEVVDPTDLAVTAPVPGHPGVRANGAWLTLTTCEPRFSASHRLVVQARLASTV